MIARYAAKDPKTPMRIGMACLLVGLVWPRFLPVTGGLGGDATDGIRGLFMGLSIGLNIWALMLGARLRHGNR